MAEASFSIVVPVRGDRAEGLREKLRKLKSDLDKPPNQQKLIPFCSFPTLHFASLVLFEFGQRNGRAQPPLLVFENNIDRREGSFAAYRPEREYLSLLVQEGFEGLDAIYSCCEEYQNTAVGRRARERYLRKFLQRHVRRPRLYHYGHPDRRLDEIREDRALYWELGQWLDKTASPAPDLTTLVRNAKRHTNVPPSLHSRWQPTVNNPVTAHAGAISWVPDPGSPYRPVHWFNFISGIGLSLFAYFVILTRIFDFSPVFTILAHIVVVAALLWQKSKSKGVKSFQENVDWKVGLALGSLMLTAGLSLKFNVSNKMLGLGILAGIVPAWLIGSYFWVKARVRLGKSRLAPPDPAKIRELQCLEDRSTQNHIAGLTEIKGSGLLRVWRTVRLWMVLSVLNIFYRVLYQKGKLETVPSIHFGHWTLVDRGRKLLFLSNFDEGWDSYLDDFFRSLATGIAYIWYHTVDFPKTRDTTTLKDWVRTMQTPEAVWYRASVYDGLTVRAINNHTLIRLGMLPEPAHVFHRVRTWLKQVLNFPSRDFEPQLWIRRFAAILDEPGFSARLAAWWRGIRNSVLGTLS